MLVSLVPTPFHDFPSMGFIFLHGCVSKKSYIVVHVEIEKRSGFSARFIDDEVVERIVLKMAGQSAHQSWLHLPLPGG